MNEHIQAVYDGIVEGNRSQVEDGVTAALAAGMTAGDILNDGMIAAMAEVGRLFEEGEYYVPEMLIAARAMKTGMALLQPLLAKADIKAAGTVAIGTVKGDLHDIGKNLVALMLEGAGFQVIDLGTDVAPERYIEAIQNQGAQIVAMSALLTTTMVNMRATIEALQAAGLRDRVKIMVGGAPVTDAFAQQIGADGYSPDASRAVALAHSLLE